VTLTTSRRNIQEKEICWCRLRSQIFQPIAARSDVPFDSATSTLESSCALSGIEIQALATLRTRNSASGI
jgi:hypothetical protein